MMKMKYKAHRLINMIFYFIVFLIGFLLGGGYIEKVKDYFSVFFD